MAGYAYPVWPEQLETVVANSWQRSTLNARRTTPAESGPPRSRPTFSRAARAVSLSLLLTPDELAVLDRFRLDELAQDNSLFYFPNMASACRPVLTQNDAVVLTDNGAPVLIKAYDLAMLDTSGQAISQTMANHFQVSLSLIIMP